MADREHFVPRRIGRLTSDLAELDAPWGAGGGPDAFRSFSRLAAALFHFDEHALEQELTEAWDRVAGAVTPVAPTRAADSATVVDDDDTAAAAAHVEAELADVLADANYTRVTMAELDEALEEESLIPLRFDIDLDDYDELVVARRGSHTQTVTIPKWKGLRSVEHTMTVDENVVVYTRVKPAAWFASRDIDPADRNLIPGSVSLKKFQHVPRADIEMLLPSIQVRFRAVDRLIVGVPAVASGIVVLATKLAPTIGLMVLLISAWLGLRDETPELDQTALVLLLGGAVTLGGFLFRQYTKLKNRRVEYLKTLSENLYFRTVGDGPGVIHMLLAAAEQQEVAEVLLGYRLLLAAPEGLTADELDERVEAWLAADGLHVDFEVDDAVDKLERLELVDAGDAGRLVAIPLPEALARLDRYWDDLFTFPPNLATAPTE